MLAGSRCKDTLDLTGGQNTILHTQKLPELQGKDVGIYSETVLYTPQYLDSRYRAVVTFYASNSSGSDTGSYTAS